jgi:dihydropteroate synthase-like protein
LSGGCEKRILLLTSRAAEGIVRRLVEGVKCVDVEVLPVNVAAFLSARDLERLIESDRRLKEKVLSSDITIVPGLVKGSLEDLSSKLGVPIVKGTRSATGIPALLEYIKRGGRLSPREPADPLIFQKTVVPKRAGATISLGPIEVPFRGPPLLIAAEVPPGADVSEDTPRLEAEGADIIVVGTGLDDDPDTTLRRVAEAAESLSRAALLAEAPSPAHALKALEGGAHGVITTPDVLEELRGLGEDWAVVVADRSIENLFLAVESATARGIKVIADPVLDIPLVGFTSSIARYIEASRRIRAPLVFSAGNVHTEVEADTHGIHALLATMALEVGASIYYIVEDGYKNRHSTAEALEAIALAERAYETGLTERGLPSRLLVVKQATPPPPPRLPAGERVGRVPPKLDRTGYFLVDVDHKRGVIVVEFRGYDGRSLRLESPSALSLARAVLRRVEVSLEHAAYLGYELCKAELALKFEKTYIQDEEVLSPPWVHKREDG